MSDAARRRAPLSHRSAPGVWGTGNAAERIHPTYAVRWMAGPQTCDRASISSA